MDSGVSTIPWRRNLVLVAGVFLTVVAALLMSQLDSLRTRLLPTAQATVVVTQVAEVVISSTPLTAISMPTATLPTPAPTVSTTPVDTPTQSPSPTLVPTITPSKTAVPDTSQEQCVITPNNWVPYLIKRGDTLFGVSLNSDADIEQVRQVNCLETDDLVAGTIIYLPKPPPTPNNCVPAPPPYWESYTVVPGDTIVKLARGLGWNYKEIQEVNCVLGNDLKAGSQIFLPPASLSGTSPPSTAVPGEATATATIIPNVWAITSPSNGEAVSGIVSIFGTANFESANVQFYKVEIIPEDGSASWVTLGDTHSEPVNNGVLETLHADAFTPGSYFLRLVLIKDSNYVKKPHVIQITIE